MPTHVGLKYCPILVYIGNILSGFKIHDTILSLYYRLILPTLPILTANINDIDTSNHWLIPILILKF